MTRVLLPQAAATAAGDEAARVRLAASPETSADVLHALAADERVTVRAAVALNPSTPDGADAILAADGDERVRHLLARKLATLIPTLSRPEQARLHAQAMTTLAGMVEDEAERVRRAIADVVKEMPEAPRALILRLAHDTAIPVSEPVVRLSPVLTSADLLALLARAPTAATATAVASRRDLDREVADAIAVGGDTKAIRALLANPSANLREAALDALIGRASSETDWHEPMVRRPKLSGRAATALSEFVATHLLDVLASRADLSPAVTAALRRRLSERLAGQQASKAGADPSAEEALHQAQALKAAGSLDEAAIRSAAQRGEARVCASMLAVAAAVPMAVVERAATMRSAKGVVSLVWLAGFTMDAAVALQTLVGRVAPAAVLRSLDGASFPLAVEEMRWQIDLLKRMGR